MAFRYRLYPTPAQDEQCGRHCADARFVWNLALEQANWYRPGRPTPGSAERNRQLVEARRESWLGTGSSSVQQQALRDSVGGSGSVSPGRSAPTGWSGSPRTGWDAGTSPSPLPNPGSTGAVVGVDLGVAHTVTISDGHQERIPGRRPSEERRLVRLQRKLARQQKGSKRRVRTKHAVASLHARASDRRRDWAEKTSTRLVTDYDLVVFENLRVKDMLRSARGTIDAPGRNVAAKAALNRRISAAAWSTLVRRTREKAEASVGCEVVLVDPRHTSQECSACGHTARENRPSQAVFSCVGCGHATHADINAAINIRARGLRVPARGGRPEVRAPSETRTTDEEAA